ncbi:Predicted arabinose efflux permease, MFS family [Monaibacterium marinum]|uniref:Predicted arabinose efflux permease, MFS family n=1 Tax=Pontivivens marinum TaxID=1690039 RepID=A0A2C9CL06_9RHOB|nr:MFS transporter [Monaibacterium marinum]SOH92201.1 Predicted arabinose efflux permease, MFS family [Monaibacterium marinum]
MAQPHHSNDQARYVRAHGAAQLLFWSGFYYLLPALSANIAAETGWPVLHISTTYTLAFIFWALCAPVVGGLIDAGHGARVMRGGAIAAIILLVAVSQVSDRMIFSALVVLLGACMAATLYEPCFAVMMRRLQPAGSDAVATVTLIAGFATLLTFPLVIGLSSVMGWQHIVLVFAGLASIGLMFLPVEGAPATQIVRDASKLPLDRGPVLIALSFGLVMMGHSILLFLLPVALSAAHSDATAAMLALAILGPAQIAGRTLWKYYGGAFSPQNCAMVMFICLCVPAALLLVLGTGSIAVYVALIIQGACYGVHTILRPSLAQIYLKPSHMGRGLGAIAMVGLLMMATGPAVGGLIWTLSGLSGLMLAILVLNAIALLLGIALRRTPPREGTL